MMKSTPENDDGKAYVLIRDNSDDDIEEPFLHDTTISRRAKHGRIIRSPVWPAMTFILAVILLVENIYLIWTIRSAAKINSSTYETGFDTELKEMKASIKLHQKRYTSAIRDHPNGTLYMSFNTSEPRYVGTPSPEIDDAWNSLLKGRYIHFTSNETTWLNSDHGLPFLEQLPSHGSSIPTTGYYGGPDMLHSLHCINAIRQHIDMDYYHNEHVAWLPEEYRRMHIDHCLEQLRQATLCHGDMTPVTLKAIWTDTPRWAALGQTERVHTCRDGMALRQRTWEMGEDVGRISFGEK